MTTRRIQASLQALLFWVSLSLWTTTTLALVVHVPVQQQQQNHQQRQLTRFCPLFSQKEQGQEQNPESESVPDDAISTALSLQDAIDNRYACTRFQRRDGIVNETVTFACKNGGDSDIIKTAKACLDLARRAPSGFNVQPYKLLLITSPEAKEKVAKYCIGHNAHRVRDSDCTVLFLADRECLRDLKKYRNDLLYAKNPAWKSKERRFGLFKIQLLIGLFSQGFPLPQWIGGPLSWGVRFGMRVVSWIFRSKVLVPTLSSRETWSQKNTMLVAMTYLLACTSKRIATCPMEGYLTWGIRQSMNIPRRYTIPLIVATGTPYIRPTSVTTKKTGTDDAGMTHGISKETSTQRYPKETVVFENIFGGGENQ